MRLIAALLLILAAAPARATGTVCQPLDEVLSHLALRWQETPVFAGATEGGAWIVTAAADGGSFTVIRYGGDGIACIAGAGDGWSGSTPATPGKEG
jgi:hypothetical protein